MRSAAGSSGIPVVYGREDVKDEMLTLHINHMQALIKTQGYALQTVQSRPSFTYTAGLSKSNFKADVLIAGTSITSIQWINKFARIALDGGIDTSEGRTYESLFGGSGIHLRKLLPRQVSKLMRMAVIMGEPVQIRGFLLVVPAANMEYNEQIMREKFLQDPVLDERNLRRSNGT